MKASSSLFKWLFLFNNQNWFHNTCSLIFYLNLVQFGFHVNFMFPSHYFRFSNNMKLYAIYDLQTIPNLDCQISYDDVRLGWGWGGGVTLAKKRTLLSTVQNNDKSSNCTLHFQQIHKTVYMSIEI